MPIVNIQSSLNEIEKKLAKLNSDKANLQAKKQAELTKCEEKILAYKEKTEKERDDKIKPIDESINSLNAEITKCEEVKKASIKYEKEMRKLLGMEDTDE